tara:strand:- start:7054 stop:7992 length:939 start_codon:yes stop_codon:yes gene_type:complete
MEDIVTGKIKILSPHSLNNKKILDELSYWLKVMERPQGWHYDMDMIWILEKLDNLNLKKGSYILDAGAGLGPLQYILAARGYNIASLDFKKRKIPKEAKKIFNIKDSQGSNFSYKHSYQNFITLDKKKYSINLKNIFSIKKLLFFIKKKIFSIFYRSIERIKRNKINYGEIDFIQGAFHKLPFKDNCFDAVVSVSALEHADISLFEENIKQMVRVAKNNSPVIITTSINNADKDTFDEQTAGYCFSPTTLSKIDKDIIKKSKDYLSIEKLIIKSNIWKSRLDPYYFLNKNTPFYKKKIKKLPYLPIAIDLIK